MMRVLPLRSGEQVNALGQGTHSMGTRPAQRAAEVAALQAGLDQGMTVIDTAENYGDGAAERLIAEAVGHRRDEVFLVSKIRPSRATSAEGVVATCEASLRRLDTDRLDLYLVHWPRDSERLDAETFGAFDALVAQGKIRHWGVSNFAGPDLDSLKRLGFGDSISCNQILYNLRRRGAEWDLLNRCATDGVVVMAYCPIEQGRMASDLTLAEVGARHGATAIQVALAWLLAQGVLAIPKASTVEHVVQNRAAADLQLSPEDLDAIDATFPSPARPVPFEML